MSLRLRIRGTAAAAGLAAAALLGAGVSVIAQPAELQTVRASGSGAQAQAARVSSILGLGDSVPAGTNCDCTDFVTLAAQEVAARQGASVTATNASVPGQTSAELIDEIDDPAVTEAIRASDVIVIEIGANDFDPDLMPDDEQISPDEVFGDELAQLGSNITQIVDRVHKIHGGGVQVIVVGYWNVFEAGASADERGPEYTPNAMAVTDASNAVTRQAATASGAQYIDLVAAFAASDNIDSLLEDDGEHPNAAGHEVIAAAVAAAIA